MATRASPKGTQQKSRSAPGRKNLAQPSPRDLRRNVHAAEGKVSQFKASQNKTTHGQRRPQAPMKKKKDAAEPLALVLRDQGLHRSKKRRLFRTNWYMTAVDGVANMPTAIGVLPEQYSIQRHYVVQDDPTIPAGAKVEARLFSKLTESEQQQAMKDLRLRKPPGPDTLIHFYKGAAVYDGCPYQQLSLHSTELKAFNHPHLLVTAYSIAQIPPTRPGIHDAEIVFVGRSNVGKSSLINALTRSTIANTGKTPGRTQSLNFYSLHRDALSIHKQTSKYLSLATNTDHDSIHAFLSQVDDKLKMPLSKEQSRQMSNTYQKIGSNPMLTLVDLPGYGYAKVPTNVADTWNVLIGAYLRLRSPLNYPLEWDNPSAMTQYLNAIQKLNLDKNRFHDDHRRTQLDVISSSSATSDRSKKIKAALLYKKKIELEIAQMHARLERIRAASASTTSAVDDGTSSDGEITQQYDLEQQMQDIIALRGQVDTLDEATASRRVKASSPSLDKDDIVIRDDDDDLDNEDSDFATTTQSTTTGYPKFLGNPLCSAIPPTPHLDQRHGSAVKNVVVLLDSRVGMTKFDIQFLNFLESFHIPHQVVLTKIDQLRQTQLEGVAYSIAQALFPHEYVKLLEKSQPIPPDYYPNGQVPRNAPSFLIRSNEQDKLWDLSQSTRPRKYCNPLIIGISTKNGIGIDSLRKSLLHSVITHM